MELTEEQRNILEALSNLKEPAGCKMIGEKADMPWRTVMGKMRSLKSEGLVEIPEEGKYVISSKGRAAIE
jgi:DNA-binding transcriptional ArsR family regulator